MKANFAFDSNFAESLVGAGEREQGAMAARNREPVLAVAKLAACRVYRVDHFSPAIMGAETEKCNSDINQDQLSLASSEQGRTLLKNTPNSRFLSLF